MILNILRLLCTETLQSSVRLALMSVFWLQVAVVELACRTHACMVTACCKLLLPWKHRRVFSQLQGCCYCCTCLNIWSSVITLWLCIGDELQQQTQMMDAVRSIVRRYMGHFNDTARAYLDSEGVFQPPRPGVPCCDCSVVCSESVVRSRLSVKCCKTSLHGKGVLQQRRFLLICMWFDPISSQFVPYCELQLQFVQLLQ